MILPFIDGQFKFNFDKQTKTPHLFISVTVISLN